MKREFYIDTPLGKLNVYAKADEDRPGDFPGVYIDLANTTGANDVRLHAKRP